MEDIDLDELELRLLHGGKLDSDFDGERQRYERWREVLNHYLKMQYPLEDAEFLASRATDGRPTITWRS